jgi:hypothetical protein
LLNFNLTFYMSFQKNQQNVSNAHGLQQSSVYDTIWNRSHQESTSAEVRWQGDTSLAPLSVSDALIYFKKEDNCNYSTLNSFIGSHLGQCAMRT